MSFTEGPASTARITRVQHALLVLAVVACRIATRPACPTYDDAFITYRYAANAAHGLGMVFDPGASWEPVLGTTTPLYTLVMALFAKLGADLVVASLIFNIALDAVTATLIPRLFGGARGASSVALFAFAAFTPLVRISVGGMESPLFLCLGLGACLAFASNAFVLSGTLAALTCVTRPEGVLLCAVLFLSRLKSPRDLVRFTLPIVVIGAIAVAWLTSIYGSPIPQSVVAKSTMRQGDAWHEALVRWKAILSQAFVPKFVLWPAIPLVAIGAWRAVRGGGALRTISLWALAITASYLVARPHTWGWYYFVPLAGWTLWFGLGTAHVAQKLEPAALVHGLSRCGPYVAAAVAFAATFVVGTRLRSPVAESVYEPMFAWAETTSTREPSARILASDIGAIGWHWRGTVLDSEGLVWPAALALQTPNNMIEHEKPEYVLLVLERMRLRHFMDRPDLFAQYEPIVRFSAKGRTELNPTLNDLDVDWSQDYLVFKRRAP